MQTFLWLNIIVVLIPLALSFHKKIALYKEFAFILPAIILPSVFFIVWEHYFLELGVWSFNPAYITGNLWFGMPVEEVMYYFCIPFACLFLYAASLIFISRDVFRAFERYLGIGLVILSIFMTYFFRQRIYASVAFMLLAFTILFRIWAGKRKSLSRFYLGFLICLPLFFIVQLLLTGLPVITYDPQHITTLHIFSVPVENLIAFLVLLLWNVGIYTWLKHRFRAKIKPPVHR
jgi:lycopene cyclase domain-containing protein